MDGGSLLQFVEHLICFASFEVTETTPGKIGLCVDDCKLDLRANIKKNATKMATNIMSFRLGENRCLGLILPDRFLKIFCMDLL